MGQTLAFLCPGCGYTAQVSGGDDAGMTCTTTTIGCRDCYQLHDVLTSKMDRRCKTLWRKIEPRCPNSKGHHWEKWQEGGPCPVCGDLMLPDEENLLLIMWD